MAQLNGLKTKSLTIVVAPSKLVSSVETLSAIKYLALGNENIVVVIKYKPTIHQF